MAWLSLALIALAQTAACEDLVLDLCSRVRWPFALRADTVALAVPGDVGLRPPSLTLGSWLYHVGADAPLHLRAGTSVRLPFRGLEPDPEKPGRYRLPLLAGPRRVVLDLRLEGVEGRAGDLRLATDPPQRCIPRAAPRWQAELLHRFTAQGYEPGPALRIVFENIDELLGSAPPASALFRLLDGVLLPRFRAASAARAPDPGPGLRGREGLVARRRALLEQGRLPAPPRRFHSAELEDLPELGFFEAGRRVAIGDPGAHRPGERQRAAHEAMLAEFLAGLRWPLPDPSGSERVLRPDDTWNRGGLEAHRALDLGSSLLLPGGSLTAWPAGTPVGAPHVAARTWRRPRSGARSWVVELEREGFRLRVLLCLYHLTEAEPARLAGYRGKGGWRSSDPLFRCLGLAKGNHAHLEILGLYPDAPRRRELLWTWHLPAVLRRAPSSAPPWSGPPSPLVLDRPAARLTHFLYQVGRAAPTIPGLARQGERYELRRPWIVPAHWRRRAGGFEQTLAVAPMVLLQVQGRARAGRRILPGPLAVRFAWEATRRPARLSEELWDGIERVFLARLLLPD